MLYLWSSICILFWFFIYVHYWLVLFLSLVRFVTGFVCLFVFFLTLTWVSRLLPTFVDFDERKRLSRDLCSRKAKFKDMDEVSGDFSKYWVDFLDSNLPVNN